MLLAILELSPSDEKSDEKQQIVITLNNEIELTSIMVNTQSLASDKPPTSNTNAQPDTEKTVVCSVSDPTYDEISETSFNIGNDITIVAPEDSDTSSSRSEETLEREERSTVIMKRRNILVRQSKLDSDLHHPDLTRKRHSFESVHSSNRYLQVMMEQRIGEKLRLDISEALGRISIIFTLPQSKNFTSEKENM